MASQSKAATPDIVGNIILLPVTEVELGERLRPIDMDWARALGAMMKADGQDEAIKVCQLPGRSNWLVVAGAHRRVGAELAGLAYIRAELVTNDQLQRRAFEVRENLFKKGLDPLDRATFIAELVTLKRIAAGISPDAPSQSVAAQARWQQALADEAADAGTIIASAYGFNDQVAGELGFSASTIKQDLFLHRRLLPDVANRLRGTAASRNAGQLKALARLPERDQREIAELIAEGTVKSVSEAVAMRDQRPKLSPEDKRFATAIGTFDRMTDREREGAFRQLAGMYLQPMRRALAAAGAFDGEGK